MSDDKIEKTMRRFWRKVNKDGSLPVHRPDLGPCWIWEAGKNSHGYGEFTPNSTTRAKAHRFAWELLHGPIPSGLQTDHLCLNRACVNPFHMELVSLVENVRRGNGITAVNARLIKCRRGHDFDCIYRRANGRRYRVCSACSKISHAKAYAAKRSAPVHTFGQSSGADSGASANAPRVKPP
jgi:hypothetical protein